MTEIRFSGFGGQGIVRCALITGKALSIHDDKYATMTQSFGPEARGGACSSQLVVSGERVTYPYVTATDILISLSQEAYDKYESEMSDEGILIVDEDLVKSRPARGNIQMYSITSTRFAEELGNRIFANLVVLGFFTAITEIVTPEAMKKALPGLVPERFIEHNIKAFDKGFDYGEEILAKGKKTAKKKTVKKKTGKKK